MRSARSFTFDTHAAAHAAAPGCWAPTPSWRPSIALQWAGEVPHRVSRAPHGDAAHLPLRDLEPQRALGSAAHAGGLDSSPARCGGDARGGAGAHRRARFFGVSLGGVPVQDPDPARRAIEVRRDGDYLWLEITANAYLHHMVRNIVGTLLDVQQRPGSACRHGAQCWRAPIAATPAPPRRPAGCTCGGSSTPRSSASRRRSAQANWFKLALCPGSSESSRRASRPSAARARCPKGCGSSVRPAMRCCTAPSSSAICTSAPSAATTCASTAASG